MRSVVLARSHASRAHAHAGKSPGSMLILGFPAVKTWRRNHFSIAGKDDRELARHSRWDALRPGCRRAEPDIFTSIACKHHGICIGIATRAMRLRRGGPTERCLRKGAADRGLHGHGRPSTGCIGHCSPPAVNWYRVAARYSGPHQTAPRESRSSRWRTSRDEEGGRKGEGVSTDS